MYFGLDIPTTGAYADPHALARLAQDAEAAGWDGFLIWDVLGAGDDAPMPALDPWIALTAVALHTTRIRLGVLATPLARDRPWLVARRLAHLDHLSGGRVICAAGLGYAAREFTAFGEPGDPATRAQKLDESLAILAGLWTGEPFSFAGQHYTLDHAVLAPTPVQRPRIPLWVAAGWPRLAPFRRAARWDGVCLKSIHQDTKKWLTLAQFRKAVAYVRAQRTAPGPFDIVMSGEAPDDPGKARAHLAALAKAGATWWVEEGLGWPYDEFRDRIRQGPPRP
jgi:alkanesulfonate monooxygenase SsuD/methylene tetrahydromethanopterin reductase-like flavin-dependent oxidoreductase (luciferase family)